MRHSEVAEKEATVTRLTFRPSDSKAKILARAKGFDAKARAKYRLDLSARLCLFPRKPGRNLIHITRDRNAPILFLESFIPDTVGVRGESQRTS